MQWSTDIAYTQPDGTKVLNQIVQDNNSVLRARLTWKLSGNVGALATKCKPKQKVTSAALKIERKEARKHLSAGTIHEKDESREEAAGSSPLPKNPHAEQLEKDHQSISDTASAEAEKSELVQKLGLKLLIFPKGHVPPEEPEDFEPSIGLELSSVGMKTSVDGEEVVGEEDSPMIQLSELSSFNRNFCFSVRAFCDIEEENQEGKEVKPSSSADLMYHTFTSSERIFPIPKIVKYDSIRYCDSITVVVDVALVTNLTAKAGAWSMLNSVGSVLQSVKDVSPIPALTSSVSQQSPAMTATGSQVAGAFAAPSKAPAEVTSPPDRVAVEKGDGGAVNDEKENNEVGATKMPKEEGVPEDESDSSSAFGAFGFIAGTLAEAAKAVATGEDTNTLVSSSPASQKRREPSSRPTAASESGNSEPWNQSQNEAAVRDEDQLTEAEEAIWTLLFSMLADPSRAPMIEALSEVDALFFNCQPLPQVTARAQSVSAGDLTAGAVDESSTGVNEGDAHRRSLVVTDPPPDALVHALNTNTIIKAKRYKLVPKYAVEGEFWYNFLNNVGSVLGLRSLEDLRNYMTDLSSEIHEPSVGIAAKRRKPLPPSGANSDLSLEQIENCVEVFRLRIEGGEETRAKTESFTPEIIEVIRSCTHRFRILLLEQQGLTRQQQKEGAEEDLRELEDLDKTPKPWGSEGVGKQTPDSVLSPDGGGMKHQLTRTTKLQEYQEITAQLESIPGLVDHPSLAAFVRQIQDEVKKLEQEE